ncbi:MAG: OmpA family protein [Rhodothermales bacterium]|nr:OmpA family protein [Rhodothermales bacterium]
MKSRSLTLFAAVLLAAASVMTGCASLSNTEKGAAAGAAGGAVVGGAIGKAAGSTAKGAIIGAVVGGTAGAIIGRQMDKQARELEQEIDDAEIERVGEGILVTFDSGILFDFDSSTLRPAARANLRELAESLDQYGNTDIMIVGHTDAVGSDDYNYRLSERRARSAADYLASLGVSRSRITTLGKGENEPVASNDTDYGRQQNRRVEIALYASEEYRDTLARQN